MPSDLRKKSSSPSPAKRPAPPPVQPEVENKAEVFMSWAANTGLEGLAKLFHSKLNQLVQLPPTPSFTANPEKNRYQNVPCLEETRVVLKKELPTDGDYIHAMRFKNHDRTYIATQGPKSNTTEDFWRMVWQQKAAIIVNLTKCEEEGKQKCVQYWPTVVGKLQKFGRYSICLKTMEHEEKDSINVYTLEIFPEDCSDSWIVHLIHHTTWNDGCGMTSGRAMFLLIRSIFRVDQLASGPVVVHCSAGTGRTGTLIMVDYMLFRLFSDQGTVDIEDAYNQLRSQRALSIQKEVQFTFVIVSVAIYIGKRIPKFQHEMDKLRMEYKERYTETGQIRQ